MSDEVIYKTYKSKVNTLKKRLIKKALRQGLSENFGDKEQRILDDILWSIPGGRYSEVGKKGMTLLQQFKDWCYNLDDNELEKLGRRIR